MPGTKLDASTLPTTFDAPRVRFPQDRRAALASDLAKLGVHNVEASVRRLEHVARRVRAGVALEDACRQPWDSLSPEDRRNAFKRLSRGVDGFRKTFAGLPDEVRAFADADALVVHLGAIEEALRVERRPEHGPKRDVHWRRVVGGLVELIAEAGGDVRLSGSGPFARILRAVHREATDLALPNDLRDVLVYARECRSRLADGATSDRVERK